MKRSDFVTLVMSTVGGILLAIGMCMSLLPEWNAFRPGIVMGTVGLMILLAMIAVRRRMEHKAPIKWNGKTVITVLLGIVGALALGVGMCMTMVWGMMINGILVGIVGIVILLALIPICKGIK
ncbi:hypothetical protein [Caproiciproducens sp. CPB-2]|uniref:hypothetical protein n=1 Tax=Caproiciproducens sp. CPB-2 TaxID=3030017 RepID=UPI0023DB30E5|nr:hypothetical protein [Caproiciproducens sp. CPB-2]MDF1494075.1 hypothetical protein [Caproiciproducens sp. CPB-2]